MTNAMMRDECRIAAKIATMVRAAPATYTAFLRLLCVLLSRYGCHRHVTDGVLCARQQNTKLSMLYLFILIRWLPHPVIHCALSCGRLR